MTKTLIEKAIANTCLYGGHRFLTCSATIYENRFISIKGKTYLVDILRSYSTVVAVHFHDNNTVYAFDYWSATTAQHIAKFTDYCGAKQVKLYCHSRMRKSEKELCKHDDFYHLIALN